MRARRLATAALVCVSLAACAGPRDPLAVGVREVASDILLGGGGPPQEIPAAPIPPTTIAVTLPIAPPPPPPPPRPPVRSPAPTTEPSEPEACPEADLLSAPTLEAPADFAVLPAVQELTYRNDGAFEIGGANAQIGVFTGDSRRAITAVEETDTGFRYLVEAELGGTLTQTVYEVVNLGSADDVIGSLGRDEDIGRGIFIVQVTSTDAEGAVSQFNPEPAIQILPFPAIPSTTFQSAGTDVFTLTTMSFDGVVVGKQRVDACGEFVDAIRVELTNGRVVGPGTTVEFTAVHDLATQFGGLSVHDTVAVNGSEGGIPVDRRNDATVNTVPTVAEESAS